MAILKITSMISTLALCSSMAFAGTMGEKDTFMPGPYVKIGSGGSYSMNTGLDPDPLFWDAAPQGYNDDVGGTALYAVAFGYRFNPMWSGDFQFIYRPSYYYIKEQTSTATGTASFAGNKTRYFDLHSNSVMANVYLHGGGYSDKLMYETSWWGTTIEPFLSGGLGVAFNEVSDFHSVAQATPTGAVGPVVSMIPDHQRTSIAFQFAAGLLFYTGENFNFDAGYRYYNGGTFTSANYWSDWQTITTPWNGIIQANEFFIDVIYRFT